MERWSKWIVGVVGIVGLAIAFGFMFKVHLPWGPKHNSGDPVDDTRRQVYEDLGILHDTIEAFTFTENKGIVPAFNSNHLPAWYGKYGGPTLEPGIVYLIPAQVVGKKLDDLHRTTFILATGPKAAQLFPRRGVAGIDYKLN